jgi:hypothetical protein
MTFLTGHNDNMRRRQQDARLIFDEVRLAGYGPQWSNLV